MSQTDRVPPATVFVDADNTLWDTDRVFAEAQLGLLSGVEAATGTPCPVSDRLGYVRAIDQAIAARHHAGLRYPAKLLIKATALALSGKGAVEAARASRLGTAPSPLPASSEEVIEARYWRALKAVPALRTGVMAGLSALQDAGCAVLIVSEAARGKVETVIAATGLEGHFTRVIEGQKRPELYRRVLRLARLPRRAFMIGDQLDRDIAPAKAAGLATIYFPGGFRPEWTPDAAEVGPEFTITDFSEAARIILAGPDA